MHTYVHTYIHKSQCVETVYELPFLPKNTGSEPFLHKSGAVRIVDWIFITGAPAWRRLGENVKMNTMFYRLLFKQELVSASSYRHIFFRITFLDEAFVRNIIIIVCFNQVAVQKFKDQHI